MKYVKIFEIHNVQDLDYVKLEFQKHGINYKIDFEHSLRLGNAYTLGDSGAVVEVFEEQRKEAEEILGELGYELNFDEEIIRFGFVDKIDAFTKNIPFLSQLESSKRIMITLLIAVLLFFTILSSTLLYFNLMNPSELEGGNWCLEKIEYHGEQLEVKSIYSGYHVHFFAENCPEKITFKMNNIITFPGLNSEEIEAKYVIDNDRLMVSEADAFQEIFEGEYKIISNISGKMTFKSDQTEFQISDKY